MEDGSPNKAMESAASYSGSTNQGGTFKYLLTSKQSKSQQVSKYLKV